ncbi:uncharacterized protein [Rutidosis leptorrhynchoides]|uniref:uncharacterized protein n=1 Tax=Rutidosis leptorrhynchoides TaxID=125765 RepID=UPI003A9A0B58
MMMLDPLTSSDEGSVCQTCGDKGFDNAFIYCCNCLDVPIHRYCLSVMPETPNELVIWYCEQCEAKYAPFNKDEAADSVKLKASPVKKKQKKQKKPKKQREVASLIAGTKKVICQEYNTNFDCEYTDCSKWLTPQHIRKKQRTNRKRIAAVLVPKNKENYNIQCGLKTGTRDHSEIANGPTERRLEAVVFSEGQTDNSKSLKPSSEPEQLNSGTSFMGTELDKSTCNERYVETGTNDVQLMDAESLKPSSEPEKLDSGTSLMGTELDKPTFNEHCVETGANDLQLMDAESPKPSPEPEKLNSGTSLMGIELDKSTCNERYVETGANDLQLMDAESPKPSSEPEKLNSGTSLMGTELDKSTCNERHVETGGNDLQLMDAESPKSSSEPEKLNSGTQYTRKELDKPTCNERHDDDDNDDTGANDLQLMDAEKGLQERHYRCAQPVADVIWRGSFCVAEKDYDLFEGCVAHLSDKACYKVFEEAKMFQSLLHLKMQPKIDLWPKSFQGHQASDDKIALYFFPAALMYEMAYDRLVEDMVEERLALRATTKNAELLIFTSLDLPPIYWRFQGKYYLWGVFRGNRNDVTSQDSVVDTKKMLTRVKTSDAFSPRSPLSSNGDIGGVDMDPESGD